MMLTLLEINKAINDKIKSVTDVPISAQDVSEPIVRPSIKVALERSKNGKFNALCREKNLTVRVYFFASDRDKYKIENAKMQDTLETAFIDGVMVKDCYIPINEVESEVTDTVLICSFDLYCVELLPDTDTSEPMEEIIYKEEIE